MELKYGKAKTYKYELDKEQLEWLTDRTNRSKRQTQFLFQLVDGDFERLKQVELQIKNCFYSACPGNKDELNRLMSMQPKSDYFSL